jgi:hypothetical protein
MVYIHHVVHMAGLSKHSSAPLSDHKCREITKLADDLLAPQKVLRCMELVTQKYKTLLISDEFSNYQCSII